MGWNTGYTIAEQTVVGAYDLGRLDKELLDVLMSPYSGSDIDSGGSEGLESKDGKTFEQIAIETFGLTLPAKPEGEYEDNPEAWDEYHEKEYELFDEVTKHYGWG